MKKILLFGILATSSLLLTNCQKKQVVYSIKPPTQHYTTNNNTNQGTTTINEISNPEKVNTSADEYVGNVSETVIESVTKTPQSHSKMVASTKDMPSQRVQERNQQLMNHPKMKQFLGKIEIKKDATGNFQMAAREGQKLNIVEKMVVKKANKNAMKPSKGFNDWNKYLRYGIIILAAAFVISIMSAFIPFIWIIGSLAGLTGAILFWYGLGIELDWWKEL